MHKKLFLFVLLFQVVTAYSQSPVVTSWLRNTTGIKGRHYVTGNPTPIQDNDSANVQQVFYSSNWVYVRTKGIPAYISGPFLDGNPSIATNQNAIFKFPLSPIQNTGTPTNTTGGNIGVFINGVALFDYRDGVSWRNATSSLCGGPIMPPCMGDGVWNRDAVVGERLGFDCSKAHPAMGNYHHHQNPSAFNLDLNVISTVCNIYASDGLYAIDSNAHSPLIGFAYDGFPIYGAYAYKNTNGTGGIVRMKSSFTLRNITTRTTNYLGVTVTPGPPVSATYPLGYFREDYQYNTTSAATPDYLDQHNGRFCVTPEYPSGTYCYFATVDARWNSAYPYVVGPTFYGVRNAVKVTAITEAVTQYTGGAAVSPVVNSMNCSAVSFSALALINNPYNGTATIPYIGGNGVAYTQGAAISSTGVTGLTATLQAGTLSNGNGNLTYIIIGTPTTSGLANFSISFGGQSCSFSLEVGNVIPLNPIVGSLDCVNAQATPGTVNIVYNSLVSIPYTAGNAVVYTQGTAIASTGVTGLTATLQAGTLAFGDGNLTYQISGTPAAAGTASFAINFGGQACNLSIVILDPNPTLPVISTMDCGGAIFSAIPYINVPYTATATVTYSGGNGANYPFAGPSIPSTGVTGLTLVLQPGTLAIGNGALIFNITGTPTATGTAFFNLDFGGANCILTMNVLLAANNNSELNFIIKPNPVKDVLFIVVSNPDFIPSNLWMYDETGRLVYTSVQPNLSTGVPTSKLPKGTYLIKIMDGNTKKYVTKKFVKG